jgi:hypothetical protein
MPKVYRVAGETNKSIGHKSTASNTNAVAVGENSTASGSRVVAVGASSYASGNDAVAVGRLAASSNSNGIAIGHGSNVYGTNSVAVGHNSNAFPDGTVVINATGSFFPEAGFAQASNVYISSIHNFGATGSGAPTANVFFYGSKSYGLLYCNVETGHIMVIGQSII